MKGQLTLDMWRDDEEEEADRVKLLTRGGGVWMGFDFSWYPNNNYKMIDHTYREGLCGKWQEETKKSAHV